MALAAICFLPKGFIRIEPPERRAGRRAEKYATEIIESVLNIDDVLLSNVSVSFDSKPTELDSVVINKYGVFIIEVKYYSGRLEGTEDNFKWTKYHVSGGGNTYVKMVKNPIKQVKRQVYILANYLRDHSVNVWVNGFAMIIGADSPVSSDTSLQISLHLITEYIQLQVKLSINRKSNESKVYYKHLPLKHRLRPASTKEKNTGCPQTSCNFC